MSDPRYEQIPDIMEQCISALSNGDLTWAHRSHSVICAISVAGQKIPIARAMLAYWDINENKRETATKLELMIATKLINRHNPAPDSLDASRKAVTHWRDERCKACHGRRDVRIDDRIIAICPRCGGEGLEPYDNKPDLVRDAIEVIRSAHRAFNREVAWQVKGMEAEHETAARSYNPKKMHTYGWMTEVAPAAE